MSKQLRLIILVNVILVLAFGIFSYFEYSLLSTPIPYDPNIVLDSGLIQAKETVFYSYAMLTFVASTILNLYFIIRLERSKNNLKTP